MLKSYSWLCSEITPTGAQGFFLALCSGISPGSAEDLLPAQGLLLQISGFTPETQSLLLDDAWLYS